MKLIKASEMKCPRLELRWDKIDGVEKECAYNLVLPLRDLDIRREDGEGNRVRDCKTVELGRTRCSGGPARFDENRPDGLQIETPFRDTAHICWDAEVLNLPKYAVYEDWAMIMA